MRWSSGNKHLHEPIEFYYLPISVILNEDYDEKPSEISLMIPSDHCWDYTITINLYLLVLHRPILVARWSRKSIKIPSADYWQGETNHNSCKEQINKELIRLGALRIISRSSRRRSPKTKPTQDFNDRPNDEPTEKFYENLETLINWINLQLRRC